MHKPLKKKMSNAIIALFSGLLLFATTSSALAMTDMQGNIKNLDNLVGKGKWTVAKVWASDCPFCRKSIFQINRFHHHYPEIEVIGISVDGQSEKKAAEKFISDNYIKFSNLLSEETEIDDYLYDKAGDTFVGTPTVILFNPKGEIAAVQPGVVTHQDLINFIRSQ